MNNPNPIFTLEFPEAKSIVVSGDIHGAFNLLVNKLCVQYEMKDTVLIVAGDCGFGFEQKGYYEKIVRRNSKRMNNSNNWIVFVRGNHDNPSYFDGKTFNHKRFVAVPDYSVLQACGHIILCVGGAISIDRQYRKDSWLRQQSIHHKHQSNEPLDRNVYWENEAPVYQADLLNTINQHFAIDTVITHTAPSFCELQSKNGLATWAANDEGNLMADVEDERQALDDIHEHLLYNNHPISHWCYGHFHQSWHSPIGDILFKMLDIMEFYELR